MKSQRTIKYGSEAPVEEQRICTGCGFCCDGTLFVNAGLNPGERGHLPEKIEQAGFSKGGKDYFRLPCNYFSGKCMIYDRKRADICSSFRCQLLKNFAVGKVTMNEALSVVHGAIEMRTMLLDDFCRHTGLNRGMTFRQLLTEIGKMQKSAFPEETNSVETESLIARSNIFEAMLIKYFRSAGDFEKLVMK